VKRWKIVTFIVVGALALAAFGVIASGVLPYRVFIVHTGSMSPTIPSTSAVIVRLHDYKVGQPISYYEQGTVITHRLVAINSNGTIVTKGDANATDDPWHPRTSAIIGGVVAAPPHLGYWLMYLKNPLGLGSILLAALTCWLIWSFVGQTSPSADETARRARTKHAAAPVRRRVRDGRQPSPAARALTARH
jgi:signal peptidase I